MPFLSLIRFVTGNVKLFAYGAAIIACFYAGWHVRGIFADSALERAVNAQIEQCNLEKRAAYEASADFQNKIRILNNRVGALKRVSGSKCVPVTTSRPDATTGKPINGRQDAASVAEFLDYAELAERYRLQVIGLQDWASKYCK